MKQVGTSVSTSHASTSPAARWSEALTAVPTSQLDEDHQMPEEDQRLVSPSRSMIRLARNLPQQAPSLLSTEHNC